ncbi:hypothetical protein EDF35_1943 [Rathayibacter sp. PhB151]|uniref:hypothetical protein n=1 Tax=Rathayibacter sp. PhB151 TaxID=2485189 RepID=UPI0010D85A54|nr:hypothetical protein [Rathayibacter sp. PhB151]TDX78729.1 hypothetical protein EDF35_1943 [Rathayibacter sp. PhB151]
MVEYFGFARGGQTTRVNEREMARLLWAAGDHGHVLTTASYRVTAVGGNRRVNIAVGQLSGCGVIAVRSGVTDIDVVDIPTPPAARGQWSLLVTRRSWDGRADSFLLLPSELTGAETATTLPPRPPSEFPPTLQRTPAVTYDIPIAWVWTSYAFTTLRIVDLRVLPDKRPASMPVDGGFYEAERVKDDLLASGETGAVVDKQWEAPRGVYTVTSTSVVSTGENASAIGTAFLSVNGVEVAAVRDDQDFSGQPTTLVRLISHPGGLLRVQSGIRDMTLTARTIATSNVHAAWTRPFPI